MRIAVAIVVVVVVGEEDYIVLSLRNVEATALKTPFLRGSWQDESTSKKEVDERLRAKPNETPAPSWRKRNKGTSAPEEAFEGVN